MKGNPGIGVAAAEWLAKQDPMLVGADNGPVEVSPNPDPQISLPVHAEGRGCVPRPTRCDPAVRTRESPGASGS